MVIAKSTPIKTLVPAPIKTLMPAIIAISRIGLALFAIEFIVMLILPRLIGEGGMETWFATVGDAFLLAVLSTPVIIKILRQEYKNEKFFFNSKLSFSFVAFNVGVAIFSVTFSVECGIMLLVPLTGFTEGSFILAALDAALLALVAAPVVFFLVVVDRGRIFTFSNTDKLRNVRRQFLLLFLPQLVFFSLITEALYFQETRSQRKHVAAEDVRRLELLRDNLAREMAHVAEDLRLLIRDPNIIETIKGNLEAEKLLIQNFSQLLLAKNRYQGASLITPHGKTLVHVDRRNMGRNTQETAEHIVDRPKETASPDDRNTGDVILISPPHSQQDHSVLRFTFPIQNVQSQRVATIYLDSLWDTFEAIINNQAPHMVGQLHLFSAGQSPIYSFGPASHDLSVENGSLWEKIIAAQSPHIEHEKGVILFATVHSLTGFRGPLWKLVSWISLEKQGVLQSAFRRHLLIFQSLLIVLAAIGSWIFSQTIVNRREADARNERAHQSRITLSALLETTLTPMTMEKQLHTALQIVSTTPWVGMTGKGAMFLTDPNLQQMHLAAQENLSLGEQQRLKRVPVARCLCQQNNNSRKVLKFPKDFPDHVPCLDNTSRGSYCIPIPGIHGPLGVMHMQLKSGQPSYDEEAFFSTVAGTLSGIIERRRMESELQHKNEELRRTRLDIIHRLGMAAEYRDQDTGLHVVRMSKYATILARAAGFSEEFCEILTNAAPMHDIGKIGIPDHILLKPALLDEHEREIMKQHTLIGSVMLHGYEAEPMNTAHIIALTHHERWDGKGYPIGVPGEEIPIEGRICAIADVFDALTSDRPYKKAWSVERTLEEIRSSAGTAFDPDLVATFGDIFPEIVAVRAIYNE